MAVLSFGAIAIYVLNYPGSLEYDSLVQLVEGRTASYSNWHPPVMSFLLGLSDWLPGPPAIWYLAGLYFILFGALAALFWLRPRPSWAGVVAAGAILFLPQTFLSQATVWKDCLFADTVLAGFVAIGLAARRWHHTGLRLGWLLASALLLALAVLTRQNGVVVVPCAAATLGLIAGRRSNWRKGLSYGGSFFAAVAVIAFLSNAALQTRADDYPAKAEQFKVLELYDITGMVYADLDMPLTVLEKEAPKLAWLIRTEAVARWTPLLNDTLEVPRIVKVLEATPEPVMARQWRSLIYHYPLRYLQIRALYFRWVFLPPRVDLCHPYHVGDRGDPEDLQALGMHERINARDVMLWHVGDAMVSAGFYSHGIFALIGLGVLVLVLRRRRDGDLVIGGLIAASAAFTATFFVISIACDYRYLCLIDLSAMAGVVYAAADWRGLFGKAAKA
ncbi:hypothetical protein GCM10008941_15310 [Rhizomicrobium palustre]